MGSFSFFCRGRTVVKSKDGCRPVRGARVDGAASVCRGVRDARCSRSESSTGNQPNLPWKCTMGKGSARYTERIERRRCRIKLLFYATHTPKYIHPKPKVYPSNFLLYVIAFELNFTFQGSQLLSSNILLLT